MKAINDYDPEKFINELCDARLDFLRGLRNWGTFGRGWAARVKDLRQYSLALLAKPAKKLAKPQDKEQTIPKAFAKTHI